MKKYSNFTFSCPHRLVFPFVLLGLTQFLIWGKAIGDPGDNVPGCNEGGPYHQGDWTYTDGSYNDNVSIQNDEIYLMLDDSADALSFSGSPTFSDGSRTETVTFDCCPDGTNVETITYSAGSYEYEPQGNAPAWPGPFATPGVYSYDVKVSGTPSVSAASVIQGTVGTITVNALEILVSNVSAEHVGTDASGNEVYASDDETGDVTITLEVNPSGATLPAGFVSWSGGNSGADQLERIIDGSVLQESGVDVEAEVDGDTVFESVVYILPGPDVNEDLELEFDRVKGGITWPNTATLGAVDRNGARIPDEVEFDYYYESGSWKFVFVRIKYTLNWDARSQGLTDVVDPYADPFPLGLGMASGATEYQKRLTAKNALTPNAQGIPTLAGYFSYDLVVDHEYYHMADWHFGYYDPEIRQVETDQPSPRRLTPPKKQIPISSAEKFKNFSVWHQYLQRFLIAVQGMISLNALF